MQYGSVRKGAQHAGWVLIVAVMWTARAHAQVASFDDITQWIGNGTQKAALVIDWNDDLNPQSLVWGYRWEGIATGLDMLQAVTAVDSRFGGVALTDWGWGWTVDGIGYDLNGNGFHVSDTGDHFNPGWIDPDFWGYYVYEEISHPWDGGNNWTSSGTGLADRHLNNGSWDGWRYSFWGDHGPSQGMAASAIPEPETLLLLNLGGCILALLRHRLQG